MLVYSPKHTAEDLRYWNEYLDGDFAHAKNCGLDEKAEDAKRLIREFARDGGCYVGVSWGKDSTVLAHLACEVAAESASSRTRLLLPLAWIRVEPIKSPECCHVRDIFLSMFDCGEKSRCPYVEIERWCNASDGEWHASGTLESGAVEAEQRFGGRRILGIRADESGTRKLTCFRNGVSSVNSCRPLAWWTAADVMAYLAVKDLPVHPAYAMLGGGRWERDRLRVASLGGRRGDGNGRREWEREYYGDELRRIEKASRSVRRL